MTSTPVDKRNFYLALSVSDGQALANSVGFAIPSIEVQNSELVDTVQKWMTLAAVGVTDQVRECVEWMTEAIVTYQNLDEEDLKNTKTVLTCYSIALLCFLIDNEYIELAIQEDADLDVTRIERLLQFLSDEEDLEIEDLDISFDADFGDDDDE
jgi:hypothetical protein